MEAGRWPGCRAASTSAVLRSRARAFHGCCTRAWYERDEKHVDAARGRRDNLPRMTGTGISGPVVRISGQPAGARGVRARGWSPPSPSRRPGTRCPTAHAAGHAWEIAMRTVPLSQFMPYGAPELLGSARRHMSQALIAGSALCTLAFVLLGVGLTIHPPVPPVIV